MIRDHLFNYLIRHGFNNELVKQAILRLEENVKSIREFNINFDFPITDYNNVLIEALKKNAMEVIREMLKSSAATEFVNKMLNVS